MCNGIDNLVENCITAVDEIAYASYRNEILLGFSSKWTFNDFIILFSNPKVSIEKYRLLVEVLERRVGWDSNLTRLINLLDIGKDNEVYCELKISLIYLLTPKLDILQDEDVEKSYKLKIINTLDGIMDLIRINSFKFLIRNKFFTSLMYLIEFFTHDFCNKLCLHIIGEKDPRNLLILFPLLKRFINEIPDVDLNQIAQILLTYYPINFKPIKNAPMQITENDLIYELNSTLSSPCLWPHVFDVFIDGLYLADNDDYSIEYFGKNVDTIVYCIDYYGTECAVHYLPQIVEVLVSECFLTESHNVVLSNNEVTSHVEYFILDLDSCKNVVSLPKWIPPKKEQLLLDVLTAFLSNVKSESHYENAYEFIQILLNNAKNSILSKTVDLKTSIHMIKTIINSPPLTASTKFHDFLSDIIFDMPLEVENMDILAALLGIAFIGSNKDFNKIEGKIAQKVFDLLEFIKGNIGSYESFGDIVEVLSSLKLPDEFAESICNTINELSSFNDNTEKIITCLSNQDGAKGFASRLFEPLYQTNMGDLDNILSRDLNSIVEEANLLYAALSDSNIFKYSPDTLAVLYNRLDDYKWFKRFSFIGLISSIAVGNYDTYFWFPCTKAFGCLLSEFDEDLENWILKQVSDDLLSKSEFLSLFDFIGSRFTARGINHILNNFSENPLQLVFIPWLERYYTLNHFEKVKEIVRELKNGADILKTSLLPILFKYPLDTLSHFDDDYFIPIKVFGLVKASELTGTNLWPGYIEEVTAKDRLPLLLSYLPEVLDELCPLRIIVQDSYQVVLDTWTNRQNYKKSLRLPIQEPMRASSMVKDRVYFIDSDCCDQRNNFSNALINVIYDYLINNTGENTNNAYRSLVRLLSSITDSIDQKWIQILLEIIPTDSNDWEDLRILCLLTKLARNGVLSSTARMSDNLSKIVKFSAIDRKLPLSKTISILLIKEVWASISPLDDDLIKLVIDYINKCGKDSNRLVRRMALSVRKTVKSTIN